MSELFFRIICWALEYKGCINVRLLAIYLQKELWDIEFSPKYKIGESTCGCFRLLTCKILSASINSALTYFSLKHLMVGIEEYVLSNIKHRFAEKKSQSTILFRFHAVATLEKL